MNLSLFMHDYFNNTHTFFMVDNTKTTNQLLYIFGYFMTHT